MHKAVLAGENASARVYHACRRRDRMAARRAGAATEEAASSGLRSFGSSGRPTHCDGRAVLGTRFYETLERLGHSEGGNFVAERFSAEGHSDRFAALTAEVVSRKPDVIVSNLNEPLRTFLAATSTIPIVGITSDPIAAGLVANLGRPGGTSPGRQTA